LSVEIPAVASIRNYTATSAASPAGNTLIIALPANPAATTASHLPGSQDLTLQGIGAGKAHRFGPQ
jgi:hypothetical protein